MLIAHWYYLNLCRLSFYIMIISHLTIFNIANITIAQKSWIKIEKKTEINLSIQKIEGVTIEL